MYVCINYNYVVIIMSGENRAGFFSFFYCHIFAHFHAMVRIYIPNFNPFNMLSNGMFHLPIHAFVYELQVEMYLI